MKKNSCDVTTGMLHQKYQNVKDSLEQYFTFRSANIHTQWNAEIPPVLNDADPDILSEVQRNSEKVQHFVQT
jgi:hypothetical protein